MKAYPICEPHDGSKGTHYQRVFDPAFHSGIAARKDDYSNQRDHGVLANRFAACKNTASAASRGRASGSGDPLAAA